MKNLANLITGLRIILGSAILLTPPFSAVFYIFYVLCGVFDVLDGFVARITKTESSLGAKLDSIADIVLLLAVLIKLFPYLAEGLPLWAVIAAAVVFIVKLAACITGGVRFRKPLPLHTLLNKATGGVLFLIPIFLPLINIEVICGIAAGVSLLTAIDELLIQALSTEYAPNIKGFYSLLRRN